MSSFTSTDYKLLLQVTYGDVGLSSGPPEDIRGITTLGRSDIKIPVYLWTTQSSALWTGFSFTSLLSSIPAMGANSPPRHVAVALVFDREAHQLLMVSSRAHPGMWIREPSTSVPVLRSRNPLPNFYLTSLLTCVYFQPQYPKAELRRARHQVKRQSGSHLRKVCR